MAERIFCGGHHSFNAFLIAHIEFKRHRAAAEPLDLGFKRREGNNIAAGKNQICARPRKRARKLLAQSATGSGDDCHAPAQIEQCLSCRSLAHKSVPGVRTTFIKLGSRAYRRSNHCGPSASGATAVMRGFTRIAPLDKSSIALGYSPADAHDPWRRICRVTTF